MFVIIIHEFSHGLAAVITGGKVINLDVFWDLSGETRSSGGLKFIVAIMGYTGSLLFGSGLFYSAFNKKFSKWFLPISSILLILLTSNWMSYPAGIIFSLLLAAILFLIPKYLNETLSSYILKILGLLSILYCVYDIKTDLLTQSLQITDAQLLAELTGISEFVWGLIWFSVSIIIIYFLLRFGYQKDFKK